LVVAKDDGALETIISITMSGANSIRLSVGRPISFFKAFAMLPRVKPLFRILSIQC